MAGPIETAIGAAKTDADKRVVQHKAIADALNAALPMAWESNGVHFEVKGVGIGYPGGDVSLTLLARVNATGELLPGLDNPYRFASPPYQVEDGTTHPVRVPSPQDPSVMVTVQQPNHVESPVQAMRDVITRVVLHWATEAGWKG